MTLGGGSLKKQHNSQKWGKKTRSTILQEAGESQDA